MKSARAKTKFLKGWLKWSKETEADLELAKKRVEEYIKTYPIALPTHKKGK